MTGSVHVAIGAALGKLTRCAPLAFVAGVLSHGAGDLVPHHDVGVVETPLVFGTLYYVGHKHGWKSPQFWGAVGGVCPDFEHIPYVLAQHPRRNEEMPEKWFPTHNGKLKHARWRRHPALGVLMQIVLFIGALYLSGTLEHKDSR